jgi:hypothetical protein
MAEYTVKAPDGKEITLQGPEGASDAEILAQAQKLYQPQPQELTAGQVAKGVAGIVPSAALGVAKPFLGINQAVLKLMGSNAGDMPVEKLNQYQQQLNEAAGPIASKFTTEPASLVGENILPTKYASAGLKTIGAIPSFMQTLGRNVAIGMPTAYAQPEKTGLTPEQFGEEKLYSTLGGAAIPAGISLGGKAITSALSPIVEPAVKKLAEAGVSMTPGQLMGGALKRLEDKAMSFPFVGSSIRAAREQGFEAFDKAAFKRVLDPIGGSVPKVAGREGMDSVESQVKGAYNELLPKLHFQATPEFNANIVNLRKMAQNLPDNLGETFSKNIDEIIAKRMSKNGSMDGIDFKKVESELSKKAKNYMWKGGSEGDLGQAFKQALVELRTTLAESNPKFAEQLKKINESFANLSVVRKAASAANTQDFFTPSQLATAVKSSDFSAGKNKTATGKALMQDLSDAGVSVLPNKVPDSGTADRIFITSPTATAIGLALKLPYTETGREMFQNMMLRKPGPINKLANALRGTSPFLTAPAVSSAIGENK